ncbi:MAG: hypothetical protein U5L96_17585 [Owenweeksia sp.]|nr:hypothetical protein [Owenweeksia sp.]
MDRTKKDTSLLFRPIGQKVFFDVLKAGLIQKRKTAVLEYFKEDDFNLSHKIWKRDFWNSESETILTESSRQRYASLLIMENIGLPIKRTKKDKEIYDNFDF